MHNPSKRVLVTGCSRGLGLAISTRALDTGFQVVGVSRAKTEATEKMLCRYGNAFAFEPCDLGETRQIRTFVSSLHERYGRFYGLVNNAGVGISGVLTTLHEAEISAALAVNLMAPILLAKYLSRGMLLNREGRIVNISSIIARTGFSGLAAYGASKAGLIGLTRSLSRELGRAGVTVNAVLPGYLETDMSSSLGAEKLAAVKRRSPSGRCPTTGEVASVVSYLLSAEASGVNGAELVVDLGSSA